MKRFLLGLATGLVLFPAAGLVYLRVGHPSVATADPPLPFEKQIVSVPLRARIEREMPKKVPIQADEATWLAGATVYQAQCTACHGLPEHPSPFAKSMFPASPQLFECRHRPCRRERR